MRVTMRNSVVLILVFVFLAACILTTVPASASAEETENTWASKASMQVARSGLGVAAVKGRIYAIGGYGEKGIIVGTNEEYDPVTDTWVFKAEMPTPRVYFATAVYDNKIYCIGGSPKEGITGITEVYDPATDTWENKTSMPTARILGPANVANGKIYLIGGLPNQTLNEEYDPATDTWTTKTPMPTAAGGASAVFNNRIYIMGGYFNDKGGAISLTQIYDPNTDTWSLGAPPPTFFGSGSTAVTTGTIAPKRIYIFDNPYGDSTATPNDPFYTNQVYDPETDNWTSGAEIPAKRFSFGVAAVDDLIYVIGGYTMYIDIFHIQPNGPVTTTYAANEQYTPYGYGTVPPAVNVVSLENNKTYTGKDVDLNFTVNKPVAWMGYSLDGQDNVTIAGNTTLSELPTGLHNVTVYAKDEYENTGVSETVTFSIEVPELFPVTMVAVVVAVAITGVILAVYFKKRTS